MDLRARILLWAITPKSCITCGKPLKLPGDEHIKCALPHWRLAMRGWAYWLGWTMFRQEHSRKRGNEVRKIVIRMAIEEEK